MHGRLSFWKLCVLKGWLTTRVWYPGNKGKTAHPNMRCFLLLFSFWFSHFYLAKIINNSRRKKKRRTFVQMHFCSLWMHSNFSFASINTEYITHGANVGAVFLKFKGQMRVVWKKGPAKSLFKSQVPGILRGRANPSAVFPWHLYIQNIFIHNTWERVCARH